MKRELLSLVALTLTAVGQVRADLFVGSGATNQILRYDGTTGAFLGVFASGGGLSLPDAHLFGPDGNLYVSSSHTDNVLRYSGTTGAFLGVFASGGGLKISQGYPTKHSSAPSPDRTAFTRCSRTSRDTIRNGTEFGWYVNGCA